jgi:DNA-binding transcriptional regulator YiaG
MGSAKVGFPKNSSTGLPPENQSIGLRATGGRHFPARGAIRWIGFRQIALSRTRSMFFRPRNIDVAGLRRHMGMTQKQFCRRFGFTLSTLRHWERGDRKPHGAALTLLLVVRSNPRAVISALVKAAAHERESGVLYQPPDVPTRAKPGRPRGSDGLTAKNLWRYEGPAIPFPE